MVHLVDIGSFKVGQGERPFLIAGPCVIESEQLVMDTAGRVVEMTKALGIPYIFKSSFDKANRTSIKSFRGPGMTDGLAILKKVKDHFALPVLTDWHTEAQAVEAELALHRKEELFRKAVSAKAELDQAQAAYDVARAADMHAPDAS